MATVDSQQLSAALLNPITSGTYPDSEEVISAELHSAELSSTLQLLSKSQKELQAEIRHSSSSSSADVDQWIAKARQLQADIERSRKDAREIVQKHEAGKAITSKLEIASTKVRFLHTETEYNEAVLQALEAIQTAVSEISAIKALVQNGDLKLAAIRICDMEHSLETRTSSDNAERPWQLIMTQLAALRTKTLQDLQSMFDQLVHLDDANGWALVIKNRLDTGHSQMDLENVVEALEKLGAFHDCLTRSSKRINRLLLQPILSKSSPSRLERNDSGNVMLKPAESRDILQVMEDLQTIFNHIKAGMPTDEGSALVAKCLSYVMPIFMSDWLSQAIPIGLNELNGFRDTQSKIREFASFLLSNGHSEAKDVTDWLDRVPRTWMTKRRVTAIDNVRSIFLSYRGGTKVVERVERETVKKAEDPFAKDGGWDNWNTEWAQEKDEKEEKEEKLPEKLPEKEGDDDVSGWGFEGEDDQGSQDKQSAEGDPDADASEAWGWDDDDDDEKATKEEEAGSSTKPNGAATEHSPVEREIVLRETYTVTEIPDAILGIISQQLEDAESLNTDEFKWLHSASPAAGLRALPALILAMFRATAPSFYDTAMDSGNVRLYNDCIYLAEQIKALAEAGQITGQDDGIAALEKFAKSAYAREMDVQRTVLRDLLDGAQGFASCTQYPYSAECDTAVSSTVDRIQAIHNEWKTILSNSALLQTTGSLLATVIDKVIKDIEDMEDISEAESQRLTGYCGQISKLDALFVPETQETPSTEEPVPMTAVYVSNWLRFQYLANILESSLVDIKYLWTEGELSLEFTADEVIDLIKALFADSHHRKNAIADIRRAARS